MALFSEANCLHCTYSTNAIQGFTSRSVRSMLMQRCYASESTTSRR
ncbi:MAG: hypothetical protein HYY01_11245 [Chloroflexi bacterium]|nr:hypothetical protein [Chloroflexota bacterium]